MTFHTQMYSNGIQIVSCFCEGSWETQQLWNWVFWTKENWQNSAHTCDLRNANCEKVFFFFSDPGPNIFSSTRLPSIINLHFRNMLSWMALLLLKIKLEQNWDHFSSLIITMMPGCAYEQDVRSEAGFCCWRVARPQPSPNFLIFSAAHTLST